MLDFASVLASVERDAIDRRDDAPRASPALRARLASSAARATPSPFIARRAYAAHTTVRRPERPQSAPSFDIRAWRNAISACDDPAMLHALRRRAAAAMHPDRGGDGAQLAECNALIDAALTISRSRT